MISVTVTDRSGRTLSGQTIDAFWVSIAHAKPFSVGINCALGARDMRPYLAELARDRRTATSAAIRTPACRTRSARTTSSPTRPPRTCASSPTSGFVNIVGGCCGTTPEHIAAIATAVVRACRRGTSQSRICNPDSRRSHAVRRASKPLTIRPDSNFQMIGERTNVTGSARFARLIRAGRLRRGGARWRVEQVRGGANLIDVNMDEGMLDSEQAMTEFLKLHRDGAGDRARAVHDRQLQVVRDSRRPQVRAGQAGRQFRSA